MKAQQLASAEDSTDGESTSLSNMLHMTHDVSITYILKWRNNFSLGCHFLKSRVFEEGGWQAEKFFLMDYFKFPPECKTRKLKLIRRGTTKKCFEFCIFIIINGKRCTLRGANNKKAWTGYFTVVETVFCLVECYITSH